MSVLEAKGQQQLLQIPCVGILSNCWILLRGKSTQRSVISFLKLLATWFSGGLLGREDEAGDMPTLLSSKVDDG